MLAEHGPVLYRTALRILGRPHDAEDCVQDVFLELLAAKQHAAPRNWAALLRWMTAMRALDRLRKRRRARETDDAPLVNRAAEPEDIASSLCTAEMLDWLRDSVTRLPPRQAEVFALRCFADLNYDEIAAAAGLEAGAVGTILHDARRQLQTMLPGDWIEGRKARASHARI